MKKILVTLLLLIVPNVYAYENEYFKIDIPNNYNQIEMNAYTYKWENKDNNHDNILITIEDNKNKHYNIKTYNEKDVSNFKDYLSEVLNKGVEKYNVKVEVSNVNKEKINDLTSISYETFWPTKDSINYDIYQKGYSFTTRNYFYMLTFTSDKKIENTDLNIQILNSLVLLDEEIKESNFITTYNMNFKKILIASVILGISAYVLVAIKKRK